MNPMMSLRNGARVVAPSLLAIYIRTKWDREPEIDLLPSCGGSAGHYRRGIHIQPDDVPLAEAAAQRPEYLVTPYGWKVARLFSRLDARVFRPAIAMFTANDAALAFPLRGALNSVDTQLDELIYDAFPVRKAS